jgi:5-oxoprolinase (ATP-hydrolysing)
MAIDPGGKVYRVKVLSTGRLRGVIKKCLAPGRYAIEQNWELKDDLFRQYHFHILGSARGEIKVHAFDPQRSILEISEPGCNIPEKAEFEITAHEEAAILAARLVTGTGLSEELPVMEMRIGSTKGTNALLEGKGTPPLLITTKGFSDLSLIGTQQRNDLFTLNILKDQVLFSKVIEVDERVNAQGEVIEELSENKLNILLREVFNCKPRVVVVAFLNSYRNPVHEKTVYNVLKTAGIQYVCASHMPERSVRFLPRMGTALINGYLMPVIEEYLTGIENKLPGGSELKIMTSSGGLSDARHFHPKDSLFSGPAGGLVGAVSVSEKLDLPAIISFDMGGTSTDVSRYSGSYDYVYETKIAHQSILSPALNIRTVAAGGGSICSYDGSKFTIGPESAGADPGPACYGAGGPLTLTDVNLLLGRINTSFFRIPVSKEHARKRLQEIKKGHKNLLKIPDEEILSGFLEIANEKMAKAIEKISVGKGYDPADYSLLTFGGAGGLHACHIAEVLRMKKVVVPYDAGILSAVGIGNSRLERIVSRQLLQLYDTVKENLEGILKDIEEEVVEQLMEEKISREDIRVYDILLLLRLSGQDDTIEIQYKDIESVVPEFKKLYTGLFGHYVERPIELESVKMVAGTVRKPKAKSGLPEFTYIPEAFQKQQSYRKGTWIETPVYDIESLDEGAKISGPAIVLNKTNTSFIDQNWEATINSDKDIVLHKQSATGRRTAGQKPEQVQLELFTNRFVSVVEEMGALLQRTAFSVNIKERLDFSCALLDQDGYLVVNAPHIPVHLGALGICARQIKKEFNLHEGDIIVTNHPAYGGSHLPDVTLLAPVYYENSLIALLANRSHHAEIGGVSPGSMPADAANLEEEGVVIKPSYIAEQGIYHYSEIERILTHATYPTRAISENLADLKAAVASIRKGQELMNKLCDDFGPRAIIKYMEALKTYAGNSMMKSMRSFPPGNYHAKEKLDDGSLIAVTVTVSQTNINIDFTGTSAQHPVNMNATEAIVYSAVLYVLRLLIDEDIPLNEGLLNAVRIHISRGMLNPVFVQDPSECPAVVGGNVEVSQRLVDTILKAFEIAGCSQGTMNNFLFGNDRFGFYETICGGVGAGDGFHGASAVHQHMTNTKITDPEVMEYRYPVQVVEFSVRKNSGGNGKWRGGDGVTRKIRFLEPMKTTLFSQHRNEGPYGMKDGEAGLPGNQYHIGRNGRKTILKGISSKQVLPGEMIVIETPGGGGYGKPE